MNYLAHAYLSFNQPDLLVGNMISDFVKGKTKFNYSEGIQKGISLHRAIDEFTDAHPATKKAKEFFRPAYRLYAGAFIDVVYDHFLAADTNVFASTIELQKFSSEVYNTLDTNFNVLPEPFQNLLSHMKLHNWLYNYQFTYGIEKSFGGLVRRAAYINDEQPAINVFNINYGELKNRYEEFFPSVKKFAVDYVHNYT